MVNQIVVLACLMYIWEIDSTNNNKLANIQWFFIQWSFKNYLVKFSQVWNCWLTINSHKFRFSFRKNHLFLWSWLWCLYIRYDKSVQFCIIISITFDDNTIWSLQCNKFSWAIYFGIVSNLKPDFTGLIFKFISVILWENRFVIFILILIIRFKGSNSFGLNSFKQANKLTNIFVITKILYRFIRLPLEYHS